MSSLVCKFDKKYKYLLYTLRICSVQNSSVFEISGGEAMKKNLANTNPVNILGLFVNSMFPGILNWNYTHVSKDAKASCHLVAPFIFNKHIRPFVIINPKNHCYMDYVIQLLFSMLRTISQNLQFNSSTEGSISKFLFKIACSACSSTDVDALKFRLVQYDKFYSGKQQEDASECLMMLIEFINKGSVPYCGSNDNNSTGFF